MRCDDVRTGVSALVDGEDPGTDPAVVRAHVESCPACRGYADRAAALRRAWVLTPAPAVPDRTDAIVHAIERSPDRGRSALRVGLAAIGVVQLAVALPLLAGAQSGLAVHEARHLAALDIAVAVGFLVAALRPSRIGGLVPVVAALVAALLAGAVLDVVGGTVDAAAEAPHLLAAGGLLAVWLLTRPPFAAPVAT